MSYETSTDRNSESKSDRTIEPSRADVMQREGITQLPSYEALQTHLRPPRAEQDLSKDDIFGILRNRRRRYVLEYLGEHDGVTELSDLAEALANCESENEEYITYRDRKRAYVSLYQTHLPKLDRAGVIEYNQPRGRIEIGPDYQYLKGYLHHPHESTLLWHRLYLGSGVVSVSLLSLIQLTAFPFVAVNDMARFALVFVIFGTVVLAHSMASRSATDLAPVDQDN